MISRLPTSSAVLDELLCRMWESSFTYLSIMICSTYNTVMMAIERYIKVVHPLRYKSLNVKKLLKRLIVATWLLGLIAFIVFVFNVYVEDAICCAVDVGEHLNVAMAFFDLGYLYLLPLLILIFCYSSIAYSLLVISRRQGPVKVSKPNPTQPTWTSTLPVPSIAMCRAESDHRQARVTTAFRGTLRTMILVAAIFVICWTVEEFIVFWKYTVGFGIYENTALVQAAKILLISYSELRRRFLMRINESRTVQKLKRFRATLSTGMSSGNNSSSGWSAFRRSNSQHFSNEEQIEISENRELSWWQICRHCWNRG